MKLKRILALVLCLAIVLSSMSFSVFAEEVTVTAEAELKEALLAGKSVKLGADIEITTQIDIPEGVSSSLDLNGYEITSGYQASFPADSEKPKHIYPLGVYGNLTIACSAETGTISGRGIYVYEGSKLTVDSGSIYGIDANGGSAIYMVGGEVDINGGHIEQKAEGTYNFALNALAGKVTVDGGWIGGNHGAVASEASEVVLNDGTFVCTGTEGMSDNVIYSYNTGSITINNGAFIADGDDLSGGCCIYDANGGIVVNNGNFSNSSGGDVWGTTGGTVINGGTFENLTETAHVTVGSTITNAGKTYIKTTSGLDEVTANVAKVGDTEYETIDKAITAWTNNTTLTLLDDVTLSDVITLKSTEHHILNLGTYTMTAASGKNAIVITACGTGSAERTAITINADATNPGGIDAGKKGVIYYKYADGGITGDDRPIIRINGGVFTGSTSVFVFGTNVAGITFIGGSEARQAATLRVTGGTFNCSVLGQTKSKLIIEGGTFNHSVGSQGDSTANRLISGGAFKSFGFMTADENNTKFWFGTSMAKSDVGVYVDDNGYIVVGGEPITGAGDTFAASSADYAEASNLLQYSSVATNDLYYTSAREALIDNNDADDSVKIYAKEIDMTGITYKGTIVVPEGKTLKITSAPANLKIVDTAGNEMSEINDGLYGVVRDPQGNNFTGYTDETSIWGEVWGNAIGSFVIKILDADGNVMGTTSLNNVGGIINGNVNVTWSLKLDAASNTDEYWTMNWTTAPSLTNVPAKVELWVDGVNVSGGDVVLNSPDNLYPVFAAKTDADGKILSYIRRKHDANANTVLASAIENGDNIAILVPGTYSVPTGKNISITGAVDGVVFDNIGACGLNADVTFNNVTFDYYPNVGYTGLQHSGDLVYNNCTFNGQVFLYGVTETFNNCTFNQNSADSYNVWTYDAETVEFNNCTFNSAGRSLLIYHEDATTFNDVTVTDCDFIASAPAEGKAAIEMDSSLSAGIKLTVDDATTATGFGIGNVSGNSLWNNKKGNKDANNDITVIVGDKTVLKPYAEVKTKAELDAAIKNAEAGDMIVLANDLNYDGSRITIEKPIILNLNGKTITTNGSFGVIHAKGGCSIINGKIVYTGTNAVIKVWDAERIEDIEIVATNTSGATIGGIVIQENAAGVDVIKNVNIYGDGLTNGIETYNCGNATSDVIGSMENVTIDANGTGMLISAPCGTATNCDINGDKTGIEIWIKGTYSASLDLVNSKVEGGTQAVYAHDEFRAGVVNSGKLELTSDNNTTFDGGENGAILNIVNQHNSDVDFSEVIIENAIANVNGKYFDSLAKAVKAAQNGETVELIWENGDAPIVMSSAVYGDKTITITGTADVDWSTGNLFIGRGGEGNGTVIFDNANLTSVSNSSSKGIHVSGHEKGETTKNDGTLIIKNSTIDLDYLINKGDITLDNSTFTVKNGFSIGGRPAIETESGTDATATITLNNSSKVIVNNHNGMGLGYEAIGIMNIDKTSAFECTQSFLITEKGTMNVNGGNVKIAGTLNVAGTLKSSGNVFGNIVATNSAVIELSGGLYTQDVAEWCADGYKCMATNDGKYLVCPDYTVEAIADVDTAVAGDTITVKVRVTKGGNYTNADWVLKYDPRYVTYIGTDDKNYKISGEVYDGNANDGYDEFDANYDLGTYTFTVNELTIEETAWFEIVDAHVHNYAMSVEFDGVEASKQNDSVAIEFKTADREIDTKTVTYNGMEQRGNEVANAPANATITYSTTENFTNGTQLPPAFVNAGTHTYYAQIKLDGYATKVVEGKLVINVKDVEPSVEWMVAPEAEKVEFIPVIKGVVDESYKNKGGKVTVAGKLADGTAFEYNFDASEFAYDGHGKAVYTGEATVIKGVKGDELLEITVKYTAGTADNYNSGEGKASVYVNKSTIDDAMEDKLASYIEGERSVVYDGQTHYVSVDDVELAKLGWTASIPVPQNGVTYYGDVEVVNVVFTDDSGKYNDYTATVMIKIERRNTVIYVNSATKKNGQLDSEAIGWGYTATPAIIGTDLGEIKIVRADGHTGEIEGTYAITATYTPNDNYIVRVEGNALTITDAVIKIEVVDNAHNGNELKYLDVKGDYTTGSVANGNKATKMILVHTDADYAFFTYKGEKMYDVTDAGYSYVDHNYAENKHETGKKYQHVYAIVVDAEYGDVTSEEIEALYTKHIAYAGKDATASYAPVKVTYDADINDKDALHTNDYSTVKGVYGGVYNNELYQISILKADYNKDKIVNTADAKAVKDVVIGK